MGTIALILVVVFLLLLVMDVPVAVAISLATFAAVLADGADPTVVVAANMVKGVNSFALLAIPFFILSGHLMGRGGMANRLIDFAGTLVGFLPGGSGLRQHAHLHAVRLDFRISIGSGIFGGRIHDSRNESQGIQP